MPTELEFGVVEKAVLGTILLDNDAIYLCGDLRAEHFRLDSNRILFGQMYELAMKGEPIDMVTLVTLLESKKLLSKIGGVGYVSSLLDVVPDRPRVEHYARMVIDQARRRNLMACASAITAQCEDESEDTDSCYSVAVDRLLSLAGASASRPVHVRDYSDKVYSRVRQQAATPLSDRPVGLPIGIPGVDRLTTGIREKEFWVVASWTGEGKCLGRGTPVMMFDGTVKAVEHVRVGDLLMGPDSTPRCVLKLGDGIGQLYRVVPSKGDAYVVNDEHILCLQNTEPKVYGKTDFNISVKAFLARDKRFRAKCKGYRVGVEFAETLLPLDPYYLGLWLGDGSSRVPVLIHNTEPEIKTYLENYAEQWGLKLKLHKTTKSCPALCISGPKGAGNPLLKAMRRLGFTGEKFIPHSYLVNSRRFRLRLLAGLIDTDGDWNGESKQFQITQKSGRLASGIVFLARSLGFAAYCSPCLKRSQRGTEGTYYRTTISGDLRDVPVLVARKKPTRRRINKNPLRVGIRIEDAGIGQYFGFEIDGDRRFLLGDFTVTHNTVLATQIIMENARHNVPVLWFTHEMSREQVMLRMVPLLTEGEVRGRDLRDPRNMSAAKLAYFEGTKAMIDNWPLWVQDAASMEIASLFAQAVAMVKQHKVQLIVVDYIQLVKGRGDSRYDRVTDVSNMLRELAKSYAPVLGVSQLAKPERGDKRPPRIFDMKESGSIEQDAHVILMPYRPQSKDGSYTGEDLVIVGKQREGKTGAVKVQFDSRTLSFRPHPDDQTDYDGEMF